MVTTDQTGVHLLPVGNERTYATRGAREVKVAGHGDGNSLVVLFSCLGCPSNTSNFPGKDPPVCSQGHGGLDSWFTWVEFDLFNHLLE